MARGKRFPRLLWVARSENQKTGNVPTAYVGPSLKAARKSCEGCALLDSHACYAQYGTPMLASKMVYKANANGGDYSLESALVNAHRSARFVRITAIGDPARVERTALLGAIRDARGAGFGVLAYTHFWRDEPSTGSLRRETMASCNSPSEADEAIARGWRAAAILPATVDTTMVETPGGNKLVVCPAQRKKGQIQCNDCGLCDAKSPAWKSGKIHGVAFMPHGTGEKIAARLSAKRLPLAA